MDLASDREGRESPADEVEILEVYLPAKIRYMAKLYQWLSDELFYNRPRLPKLLYGFSIYEVNGAFRSKQKHKKEGDGVSEERTAVVRIVLDTPGPKDDKGRRKHEARIASIAREFQRITDRREEELWLIRTPARRTVVKG